MKVVAICALQNLVMYSLSNKRAVAEAGGVQVVLDLIGSSDPETSVQAAMFVKLLFSNHTIQEYASSETVRAITAAIEKDFWATGTVNEDYLKALNSLFSNFPHLRATETATLTIPHFITSPKTGSEATQEAALDSLFLLRQAWSACLAEVSRAQSVAAAGEGRISVAMLAWDISGDNQAWQQYEAISRKPECLLQTYTWQQSTSANQDCINWPESYESFAWTFESPPKGQKLHISCENKSKMGKSSFRQVTIQIARVVMVGAVAGEYTLLPESKSRPSQDSEIEFQWSNK